MNPYLLVLTSVSEKKAAEKMAQRVVDKRLAACVTVSSSGRSFYWWKDQITEDEEFVLFIKTKKELFTRIERIIQELHPYDLPEIIAVPIVKGYQKYLDWIDQETRS
ncbi:MAG: divalent cation tolerance protein CutA [Candidatus Aminicenantes bacterium]|nr:divalent cation tolerance protein CutA [Candidatus Aminicenantes bacterium]